LNSIIDAETGEAIRNRQESLADKYFDIRTFGAVLSTGDKGAGTIRGPVQFTFSRSEDRIFQAEHSITRCAVTTAEDAKKQESREYASTFGRKTTVPYALYRMHGYVSAIDAAKTKFSEEDLQLLWKSLINAFEHDRAAARGEMNPRKLVIFKHTGHMGNELSGRLFDRVTVNKNTALPRSKDDYTINVNKDKMPSGIEVKVWPDENVF
jgi:CRISPR-associated protein Csd2